MSGECMGRKKKIYSERFCKICGILLNKDQDLYCSRACLYKGLEKPGMIKVCRYCGKPFERKPNGAKEVNRFCSISCSSLFYGAIRRENKEREKKQREQIKKLQKETERLSKKLQELERKIEKIKPCFICGELMVRAKSTQTICAVCRKKADNIRRDKRLYRNGKPDLSITLEKVYERDLGICQLCNRFIIFGSDTNADYYPSIDHIKPLSKGGKHEWNNVQLACRKCNTEKGNRA